MHPVQMHMISMNYEKVYKICSELECFYHYHLKVKL